MMLDPEAELHSLALAVAQQPAGPAAAAAAGVVAAGARAKLEPAEHQSNIVAGCKVRTGQGK